MIKTIKWFIYFWLYQLVALGYFLKVKVLEWQGREEDVRDYVNKVVYSWAKGMVEATGAEIKLKGEENIPKEPVLFVANHQGSFDIPLLLGYINKPKAFIAKWELRYMPLVSSWMKRIGCIFIKRNDFRQTLQAFKNAGSLFKQGQSLVIFPEGTRSQSNKVGKFKRGSLKIALREEVPIVPVVIRGSYKLREANDGLIKAAEVEMNILDPIYTSELSKEEKKDLTINLERMIRERV